MSQLLRHGLTLSIVIPTPGDTAALEETLLSVLENRPEGCEVIVALACDYDDPWGIAEEVRFVRAPAGTGWVGCANTGVAASEGDIVHLLAPGWKALPGWADAALERFADPATGAVIPLGMDGVTPDRVVSAGVRFKRGGRRVALSRPGMGTTAAAGSGADRRVGARRPRGPVVGPRLEAGFWRAELIRDGAAGFSAACGDQLADADMAVELAARGLATVVEENSRVTVGESPRRERGFRAGLHGERLFWRSLAGRPLLPALLLHACEVLRHAVAAAPLATVPMLLGRLVAALQIGSYLPRYRQLSACLAVPVGVGEAEEEAANDTGRTIRIDEGHAALSAPRRQPRDAEPLRKSA
jgi:hypothetical protein